MAKIYVFHIYRIVITVDTMGLQYFCAGLSYSVTEILISDCISIFFRIIPADFNADMDVEVNIFGRFTPDTPMTVRSFFVPCEFSLIRNGLDGCRTIIAIFDNFGDLVFPTDELTYTIPVFLWTYSA